MAIDYPGELFPILGKYIKSHNLFQAFFANIQTGMDDIETILEANTLNRLYGDAYDTMELFKRDVESWSNSLISEVKTVMTDRDFIQEELLIAGSNFETILQAIIEDFGDQSKTIARGTVVANTILSYSNPTFAVVLSGTLDGVTSPSNTAIASKHFIEELSVLQVASVSPSGIVCVSSPSPGNETYRWLPIYPVTAPYKDQDESPAISSSFPSAHAESIIPIEMNNFTSDVPDGWNMVGTPSTDFAEYHTGLRTDMSMVVKNNITMTKTFTELNLTAGKGYFVSLRTSSQSVDAGDHVNTRDGITLGSDTFNITISGVDKSGAAWSTVLATQATNKISDAVWNTVAGIFVVPFNAILSTLTVKIVLVPYAGDWTIIDEIVVSPARYFNGHGFMVSSPKPDSTPLAGDVMLSSDSWAMYNSAPKVFEQFFRKAFGVQLPNTTGTATCLDSLAT